MTFSTEALLLFLTVYFLVWYVNSDDTATMHRGRIGRRARGRGGQSVLPSYPNHAEAKTSSNISGSSDTDSEEKVTTDSNGNKKEFYPCLEDVSQVRLILRQLWSSPSSSSSPATNGHRDVSLPDEVIDIILDEAEYWPSIVTKLKTTPFVIAADGDRECLRTPPLCYDLVKEDDEEESSLRRNDSSPQILLHRGMHPCRKIVFDISSHDQGWGGETIHRGTFKGSWTWFDAYISSPRRRNSANSSFGESLATTTSTGTIDGESDSDPERRSTSSHPRPFLPEPTKLQCNRTATIGSMDHHIVWHYRDNIEASSPEAEEIEQETGRGAATLDGSAVRNMQVGDEVSVWMRARFAGWRNHVDKMSVRVFWAA